MNVNPAFLSKELAYCINKVGIKTLIIAEKFKSTNYIEIVQTLVPELDRAQNPLDLGLIRDFPTLKNIVLFGEK